MRSHHSSIWGRQSIKQLQVHLVDILTGDIHTLESIRRRVSLQAAIKPRLKLVGSTAKLLYSILARPPWQVLLWHAVPLVLAAGGGL